eukprot:jgi/Tetstr1/464672/TSEL_009426.t1
MPAAGDAMLNTSLSRGADEWGNLLGMLSTPTHIDPTGGPKTPCHGVQSLLKFPSLDGSWLDDDLFAPAQEGRLQIDDTTHAPPASSLHTPAASADLLSESGSEAPSTSAGKRRRSDGQASSKRPNPENSARLKQERVLRKREASKQRYAEQKSRLDLLQAREAGLREQNDNLRLRLAAIEAEISALEER